MNILEQIQENALKVDFDEKQQAYFDKLMSELEQISGGLGFSELRDKAKEGGKEALQVMRDYITKKEQIVVFIENKTMFSIMAPDELLKQLWENPSAKIKQNTERLMKTRAYANKTGVLWDDYVECLSSPRSTSTTYFLATINSSLAYPGSGVDHITLHTIADRCKNGEDLYRSDFNGAKRYSTNSQLYGVLAHLFIDQKEKGKDFYEKVKKSPLYEEKAEVWYNVIGPDGEVGQSQETENYLLQVIIEYFLGNEEKAEKIFKDLKHISFDSSSQIWGTQLSQPKATDFVISGIQLLGILAQALVDDPLSAHEQWQNFKKTEQWDKEKEMWRYMSEDKEDSKVKIDPEIHTRDQFLENILVAVFEKLQV